MLTTIRPADSTDQSTIRTIVRAAHLNPIDLQWQNFVVAEQDGQIVGVGQIRPHKDGCRELASIAVRPEQQRNGVGGQLVRTLQARAAGPLYLMCAAPMANYYWRFGFQRCQPAEMPGSLRWKAAIGNFLGNMNRPFGPYRTHVLVMRWPARQLPAAANLAYRGEPSGH
ncbi:MAG: GNAT family N-acetyltransferase [Caldilineaceae bacterium]